MNRFDESDLAEHGRRFFEISSDLLAIVDAEGSIVWVNDSWRRILGIDPADVLGDGFLRLVHPDDREATAAAVARSIADGVAVSDFENRYLPPDGDVRAIHWSTTMDLESGLIYAAGRDITGERRSRDDLAASRRRLAEAQRISHLGAWTYDPDRDEVLWSEELYRIFRIDPSQYEPSYEGHLALVHPDDTERLTDALERLWEKGEPYTFDYRVVVGDGETVTLFTRARIERREDGSKYIAGVCQDVTEARESEAKLAHSVAIHSTILEATADGIIVTDSDGATVSWNQNFADMWHIPSEVMETPDRERIAGVVLPQVRDQEGFLTRINELYANPEQEGFDVLEFKDGRVWERYSAPHRLDGEVVGRVWSFRDITARLESEREKLELEARLQQSERLESLGRLAGGIAHDFNNHLVAILNYATLAGEDLPDGAAGREDLDEVIQAAERASALTRELVAFSRQEMVEPRPLSLNALIVDVERLLRRTIGENVELRVHLGRDLPTIEADPSQLERVLVNLAVNGRDAMPDGGTLEITTEGIELTGAERGADDSMVRLTVRDEGAGMSDDVAMRALEPFYTTKPKGEGTGLGLATVYGIVSQNGGQLAIDSAPGEGTTMTIDWPGSSKAPVPVAAPAGLAGLTARGTVLVVEDEEPVRRLTARLLSDAGFATVEASQGEEALELLESAGTDDLCLLLTDIVMPKMSGRELTERVHEQRPELPVLFMSGYTDDVIVRHGVATAELPFISKPFTRETLLDAVNEAIEGSARALG